jgi:hypothetical protein
MLETLRRSAAAMLEKRRSKVGAFEPAAVAIADDVTY